jgi:FkbM family methyltransferase
MSQTLKKLGRKAGVVLRGGWRPVMDRWRLQKRNHDRFDQGAIKKEGYYSQHGQDKWVVEKIFKRRGGGFFVDIGAYNGVDISNTYYLEQQLGWSGICVEPIPKLFAEVARNRKCACVHGCVAARDEEVEFLEVEGCETLSGLATALAQTHDERIIGHKINKLKLPGFRLDTLLRRHKIQKVDFMSIDTEGSEMDILRNFDWSGFEIHVICVENTYFGDRLPEFLYRRGYRLDTILGSDEIYVRA